MQFVVFIKNEVMENGSTKYYLPKKIADGTPAAHLQVRDNDL